MLPELETRLGIRFESLITATTAAAKASGSRSIGVLATPITLRSKLYETPLLKEALTIIKPSVAATAQIEALIRRVIANDTVAPDELRPLIKELVDRGAEQIILGCSELSTILEDVDDKHILDPLTIITKKALSKEI
jgi:aspartate racemase